MQILHNDLTAVLGTELRETSHCALNNANKAHKFFYSGGLCTFKFWFKYLEIYGTEDDKKFLKQGKEKNFYKKYHYLERIKKYPGFTDDDPMLSPSVSYSFSRKYWKLYDINYESRNCDLCKTCFCLRCAMNVTKITQEKNVAI